MSADLVRHAEELADGWAYTHLDLANTLTLLVEALEVAESKLSSISAAREKAKTTVSGRLAFTDQVRHILEAAE